VFCIALVGEICIVPYNLFINQYEVKSLYCGVQEEETQNHSAQQHYMISDTNIRWWKKQKEQLNTARTMMFVGKQL
jgi:hypothetical protein